jgi:hypothetical protein
MEACLSTCFTVGATPRIYDVKARAKLMPSIAMVYIHSHTTLTETLTLGGAVCGRS